MSPIPSCGFPFTTQLADRPPRRAARPLSPASARPIRKDLPIYVFSGERDPVGANVKGLIDGAEERGLHEAHDPHLSGRPPRDAERDEPRRGDARPDRLARRGGWLAPPRASLGEVSRGALSASQHGRRRGRMRVCGAGQWGELPRVSRLPRLSSGPSGHLLQHAGEGRHFRAPISCFQSLAAPFAGELAAGASSARGTGAGEARRGALGPRACPAAAKP